MLAEAPPEPILRQVAYELGVPYDYASLDHLDFFASKAPELVASGWMGAGKSRVLCQKAWWIARTHPGVTVALFRKTAASLPATTARTFERDVVDYDFIARRNKSESWWELTNGSRIYFLGLDPDPVTGVPSKVGSLDLGWAGVDEAVELTEEDWIMLLGRLRDPHIDWYQLAAATNPAHPKHWLRMRMLDEPQGRELISIHSNKFLPPHYMAMLENLPDTAAGRRLGRGEWAAAEGTIWHLPDDQIRRHGETPFHRVVAGLDWGFVHPLACEVVGQTGGGHMAVLDEVYAKGRTLDEVIPTLLEMRKQYGISLFYADPSEPAYILQCQRAGLPVIAATNDVDPGLQAVATAIKGGMTVDPKCQGLLGEIPGYVWAPARGGGLKEEPVKVNDDACDALRYAVMGLGAGNWSVAVA